MTNNYEGQRVTGPTLISYVAELYKWSYKLQCFIKKGRKKKGARQKTKNLNVLGERQKCNNTIDNEVNP